MTYTIADSALEGLARELIRTTSLLERTNRELRRKFLQVCCFGCLKGAAEGIPQTNAGLPPVPVRQTLFSTLTPYTDAIIQMC
jgi:hypothetical protein